MVLMIIQRLAVTFVLCYLYSSFLPGLAQQVPVPNPSEEARLHSVLGYASYFWNFLFTVCVLTAIVVSGLSAALRDFIEKRVSRTWLQCVLFLIVLQVVLVIAYLPQSFLIGFAVPHFFKLSNQTFDSWLSDCIKSELIGVDSFVEAFAVFFFLVRKCKTKWPVYICVYQISTAALNLFAYPMFIAPLFNEYRTMPECVLREKIVRLADKTQLEIDIPIVICDASKQTTAANAQVEGFGSSTRIVVWDNTLNKMPEDEIVAVLAHEIGHYRLHHVYWLFLLTTLCSLALVPVNIFYTRRLVGMLPARFGIRDLGDWAVTPVILLCYAVVSFFVEPISNGYSRYIENQADEYALRTTANGPVYARAMIDLGSLGLNDPNVHPFIEFWLFNHPSIRKRVERANQYTLECK